jgi:DNA-binding transcriptional LysR family regulator
MIGVQRILGIEVFPVVKAPRIVASSEQRRLAARLRFKHLQLIETLARTGTILRAATEMGITQSAASKILLDAERLLEAPIFERQTRGLVATAAGITIMEFAKRSLNELNNVAFETAKMRRGGAGSLRIGAIMATAPGILPDVMSEIRRQRPLLTIHLTATTSDEIITLLRERRIEIGLCRLSGHSDKVDFDFEELFDEEYWIFAGADHPLARSRDLTIKDLSDLPWVLQPWPSPSRQIIERSFAAEGVRSPVSLIETTSRFATLNLVQYAGMVSLLPSTILAKAVRRGELAKLSLGSLKPDTNYGLVKRKHDALSEPALLFAQLVREQSQR